MSTMKTVAIVGLVGLGGYLAYNYLVKGGSGGNQKEIPVGARPYAVLVWQNNSDAVIQPYFSFDLHPNFTLPRSWVEGVEVAGAALQPLARQTIVLYGMTTGQPTIPADWHGVNVNAKIAARIPNVADRKTIWEKADVFTIV